MKRLLILCFLAAFAAGCRTTAMKGTPFFTGEYKTREGDASDRVNLWPIAYYRNPALSVLWPIGEFAPDRVAVRPLFSKYRDGDSGPWTEYNWLGGLMCIDRATHENVAFPFYWGDKRHSHWEPSLGATVETTNSYFHIVPLWWSSHDPGADKRLNVLFPLWAYSQKGDDTILFCPWPIAGSFRDPKEHRYFLFPLWDRTRWPDHPERHVDRFGLFLAGRVRGVTGGSQNWVFPMWYSQWSGVNNHKFYSLPWASKDNEWRSVPLLLSAWEPDGEWGRVLLGLGGWNKTSTWTFPLWYQDSATGEFIAPLCYRKPSTGVFVSPLWASKKDSWRAVPPLLTWWNGDGSGRALLGLGGWDDSRSWAIPLYYRDAASDTLVTPLWAHQAGHWSAMPPLLSWRSVDPATGDSSLFLLGGLVGATPDAHWLAPLYFRDEARDRFYSLPYVSSRNWHAIPPLLTIWNRDLFLSPLYMQDRHGGAIPPLLTWWDDRDGVRVLLGLGGSSGSRDWAIPFYWRDTASDRFLSPVWAQGRSWNAVPLLLTAWRRDGTAGVAPFGIGGWFDEFEASWFLPFWFAGSGAFYSLPYSSWTRDQTTYHAFATVLAGWKEGRESGWWLLPFWGSTRYRDQVRYRYIYCLLGGGNVAPSQREHWFFPLFRDRSNDDVTRIRAEMDSPRLPSTRNRWVSTNEWTRIVRAAPGGDADAATVVTNRHVYYETDAASSGTEILLGLAGTEHRSERTDRDASRDLSEKSKNALPPDGAMRRYFFPPAADSPDAVARYRATDGDWFFPLWSHERRRATMFGIASGEKELDAEDEDFSLLLLLYDYKRESVPADGHEYVRRRVLWRLYHHEELNGDETTDVFPAITWDRRKDGYRKASFLWRLFRWERDPVKGTSLDILFLPVRRSRPGR